MFLIWVSVALEVKAGGWGIFGGPTIVYMSIGVFRGKESLNRIEISRLVHDLLNFGVLGSLQLWGLGRVGWMVVWGGWKGPLTHMHMHAHTCTCTHIHTLNMIISIANG